MKKRGVILSECREEESKPTSESERNEKINKLRQMMVLTRLS